jgi:hypothetical protein
MSLHTGPLPLNRRQFLAAMAAAPQVTPARARKTTVAINGDQFLLNGKPTYPGRRWEGHRIEGLLMNMRVVQGIFDDENPESATLWKYPDTGRWDPQRNTREFVAAMPEWRRHGLLSFDICLQGGNPQGYRRDQPWKNNAFQPDGQLKPAYMERLELILAEADRLGMVPMLCVFYFGQDQHFTNDDAIRAALRNTIAWLHRGGYRNVLIEIANECNNAKYDQPILKPDRIVELFEVARAEFRAGKFAYPLGVSFNGGGIPPAHVVAVSDYLLLHGNGVKDPRRLAEMVQQTRKIATYRPMPILVNEDDHFDFDKPVNNMLETVRNGASWGLMDIGDNNYTDGYQSPPVNWGINTERKRQFFALLKTVTGA